MLVVRPLSVIKDRVLRRQVLRVTVEPSPDVLGIAFEQNVTLCAVSQRAPSLKAGGEAARPRAVWGSAAHSEVAVPWR